MSRRRGMRMLIIGLAGGLVAALCCFTPLLVILLGVLGLSALTGYLDLVLWPALGLFLLLALAGAVRVCRARNCP